MNVWNGWNGIEFYAKLNRSASSTTFDCKNMKTFCCKTITTIITIIAISSWSRPKLKAVVDKFAMQEIQDDYTGWPLKNWRVWKSLYLWAGKWWLFEGCCFPRIILKKNPFIPCGLRMASGCLKILRILICIYFYIIHILYIILYTCMIYNTSVKLILKLPWI